ncbi:AAA family ATPase [Vibrio splendidus]|uniref:AAA family ATPase n=1 Tax=Vibrio splendidus TaxID=29497 RepID=UPI000D377B13|nr:DUF3696 domain-containing protein [Vibrio splendidus]PTP52274.1 DUF3696 domain-containing protein [Vibrio splendidus]
MKPIKNITLENFKAYQNESFDLNYLTVFCGSNSVGKSTAIQSLGILFQSRFSDSLKLNDDLVHVGKVKDVHNFSNRDEDRLIIKLTTHEGNCLSWGYENADQRELAQERNLLPSLNDAGQRILIAEHLRDKLKLQYIEAERFGPRDSQKLAEHSLHPYWLGTKGEHSVEVLKDIVTKGRHELTGKLEDPRKHSSIQHSRIFDNIEAWMGEISPGHKLSPEKEERANIAFNSIISSEGDVTKPINIGFGYSYSLGIVSALLLAVPGDLVIIENPEAHLHPKGQSYLGRLIALTSMTGIQVVVETHSDHLLNGIRVIARIHPDFDPSIFTLYYISQVKGKSEVEPISLTKDGKLSNWPEGFFDQQAQDMFTIMTGKTELPGKES